MNEEKLFRALNEIKDVVKATNPNIADKYEIFGSAKEVMSLDYILTYIQHSFPHLKVSSIRPFCFTIGSNNHGEGIENQFEMKDCFFFGRLQICINPNGSMLSAENIEIKYRSWFNNKPFEKTITRIVEKENYINEASESLEFFDQIQISQASTAYDFYVTLLGFKLDYV